MTDTKSRPRPCAHATHISPACANLAASLLVFVLVSPSGTNLARRVPVAAPAVPIVIAARSARRARVTAIRVLVVARVTVVARLAKWPDAPRVTAAICRRRGQKDCYRREDREDDKEDRFRHRETFIALVICRARSEEIQSSSRAGRWTIQVLSLKVLGGEVG